jgi:hypothetical protein
MKYFVSRQCYWPDGKLVVEIATGGLDYANPDMVCSKYPGEGREYDDPREAAKVAIEIAKQWRKDKPGKRISVAYGCTSGYTLPFEPSAKNKVVKWANETYEKLPKCDQCGELLPEVHYIDEFNEFKFCREYCIEKWHQLNYETAQEV